MKNVIMIVTDGERLRAFRFSPRLQDHALRFLCTEVSHANPPDHDSMPSHDGLPTIAEKISDIMADENPALWHLVVPDELRNPLLSELSHEIEQTLTRTVAGNLMDSSLTTIATLFPPTPSRQAAIGSGSTENRHCRSFAGTAEPVLSYDC